MLKTIRKPGNYAESEVKKLRKKNRKRDLRQKQWKKKN